MATNAFNFGPELDAVKADTTAILSTLSTVTKVLTDLVDALGGGDQPAINAATTALRGVTEQLSATVARDKDT
jgi:hypothetical protein